MSWCERHDSRHDSNDSKKSSGAFSCCHRKSGRHGRGELPLSHFKAVAGAALRPSAPALPDLRDHCRRHAKHGRAVAATHHVPRRALRTLHRGYGRCCGWRQHRKDGEGRDGFHVAANTRLTRQLLYHQRYYPLGKPSLQTCRIWRQRTAPTFPAVMWSLRIGGAPRGVDRSSIRFLRWQLVHQLWPLLLNHLSDIV